MRRGSWAMVFRGRKEDAAKVLEGAKALKDVEQFEQFCNLVWIKRYSPKSERKNNEIPHETDQFGK